MKKRKDKGNRFLIPVISLIGLFSLLSGWTSYQEGVIPTLERTSESRKVTIETKVYTPEDSKQYLKRDLISRGFQPIQMTIHNNTTSVVTVEDFDAEQPTAGQMARQVMKDVIPRSIGYRVASLVFWPFAIPATIDTIKNLQTYSKMKRDFAARSIKLEIIPPYSTLNRVLFVRSEDLKDNYTLTLYDQFTGKLDEYKVDLEIPQE
jgi:hypothetical protein